MTDRIEKTIDLKAPTSRVWKALTDHEEFGKVVQGPAGRPPSCRARSRAGRSPIPVTSTSPGRPSCRRWSPKRLFLLHLHPYGIDPQQDYSGETRTLVEFTLEKTSTGTRLTIVESGFDKLPAHRRDEAFRMNDGGWSQQIRNIAQHVDHAA